MTDGVHASARDWPSAPEAVPAARTAWRCACEVCATVAASEPAYFALAFGEPRHAAATRESIADAFGLCPRHGATLIADGALRAATMRIFEGVVPQVLPWLEAANFGNEKFQQVYFSARDACPACAYERRAAGRHAARLGRRHAGAEAAGAAPPQIELCAEHFQLLARGLAPALRMPALAAEATALELAAQAVESAAPSSESPALAQALARTATTRAAASAAPRPSLAEALQTCVRFEQAMACPQACPVCLEVERARQRWIAAVPVAAAHRLDESLFYPTCPEHVATIASLGDATLTATVAAHALRVAAELARQQLRALVRAAETQAEQAAARIVRWGRRPRRRPSDPPKPPAPKVVRCAACERLAIAQIHATSRLLRLLQSERHRLAFERGWGLCMKHHAQAYLMSPKGPVRDGLAADQARRLSEFMLELKDERSARAQHRRGAEGEDGGALALRRFCGFA